MKKNLKSENIIKPLIAGLCLLLTGCGTIGLAQEATFESAFENGEEEEPVNIYTSQANGVVEGVDTGESEVTLYLTDRKEERTFHYDGATGVWDRYGSAMSMEQMAPGDLVSITYNSELEKLGSVTQTPDSWSYDELQKYVLDAEKNTLQAGEDSYSISQNVRVFSAERQIELSQILKQDVISVKGTGHEIASIVIEKGHGYLDLKNEDALVGGWIEVGQNIIQQISQDMLVVVPEGNYTVRLTANGIDETREISIERDKETVLNLGDIEVEKPTSGKVVFKIEPEGAEVLVDEIQVDASRTVLLPLGLHRITVSADGYDTLSEYFEVDEETTTVKMKLEEKKESSVSGNKAKDSEAEITIAAPVGAEVYQDNRYIGIAPVTYEKTAGSHVITLRRTGYITRSYDIEIEDDDRDVTYSFPELEPEDGSKTVSGNAAAGNGSTVSGNQTVSGNGNSDKITVSGNQSTVSGNASKS